MPGANSCESHLCLQAAWHLLQGGQGCHRVLSAQQHSMAGLTDAADQLVFCLEQCEVELRAVSHRLADEFSRRPFQHTVRLCQAPL